MSSLPLFESSKKPKSVPKLKKIEKMLTDPSTPLEIRLEVLRQLSQSEDDAAGPILARMIEAASTASGEDQYRDKIQELADLIQQMQAGPLRCALFLATDSTTTP